jgi:hypothetical protein
MSALFEGDRGDSDRMRGMKGRRIIVLRNNFVIKICNSPISLIM